MTIKKPLDMLTGLAFLAASLFLLKICFDIPAQGPDALGPRFLPLIILVLMTVLSCIVVIQSFDFSKKAQIKETAVAKEENDPVAVKMQVAFIVFLGGYILLMPFLGYTFATFGFCFLAMTLLGPKNKKAVCINALMAGATALALTYIFGSLLHLFLP